MEASQVMDPAAVRKYDVPLADGDVMSEWALTQYLDKYSWKEEDGIPTEVWPDTAYRTVSCNLGALGYTVQHSEFQGILRLIAQRKFIPGGRYLAMAGRQYHQISNCYLMRCPDSREGWADTIDKGILALSGGGGVGVVWSDVRGNGSYLHKTGGRGTGPLSPARMLNEVAREVKAGNRRSAIWGGLHWNHPDIMDWIHAKDWSDTIKRCKEEDFNFPAPLDMTNISVILDSEFFMAYHNESHPEHQLSHKVYWESVAHMLEHGEPGFSVDVGQNARENLRNPCCEITSEDPHDVCNLGSINLSRIEDLDEMKEAVRLGTLFLLAGTVYGDLPYIEVRAVREKNRRLGLGLMGVHEWLVARGYDYSVVPELREWLDVYQTSGDYANEWADRHCLSRPVKTRAIAPNGTISIIGETTSGMEPMFCVAYKRRFLDEGKEWRYQYVIDPLAKRLADRGIDPDTVETAHILALNPEKRIKFQADLQEYVDHAISSTINLAAPITDPDEVQDWGETLMGYLPRLRGITVYPEGSRAGQPLTPVTYYEAHGKEGVTYDEERAPSCMSGNCGI